MAATTTPLISQQLKEIIGDFSQYKFAAGDGFVWSSSKNLITYTTPSAIEDIYTLLHEIAHAELGHQAYSLDIELIKQEVAAWEYARKMLAPRYGLAIEDDHIQDHIDSYRLWLHQRSRCPGCGQNGAQPTTNTYSCSNCRCLWQVNDARLCRLRRVRLQDQNRL